MAEKPPTKGFDDSTGHFAADAQITVLERVSRVLEAEAHRAFENFKAVQQVLEGLQERQRTDAALKQHEENKRQQRTQRQDEERRVSEGGSPPEGTASTASTAAPVTGADDAGAAVDPPKN